MSDKPVSEQVNDVIDRIEVADRPPNPRQGIRGIEYAAEIRERSQYEGWNDGNPVKILGEQPVHEPHEREHQGSEEYREHRDGRMGYRYIHEKYRRYKNNRRDNKSPYHASGSQSERYGPGGYRCHEHFFDISLEFCHERHRGDVAERVGDDSEHNESGYDEYGIWYALDFSDFAREKGSEHHEIERGRNDRRQQRLAPYPDDSRGFFARHRVDGDQDL